MDLSTADQTLRRQDKDPSAALQSRIQGQVIQPSDTRYDEARLAWNRAVDQRPALIVIPTSAADVSEAVQFASSHGLGVAVQSTGHGVTLGADGALLLITSQLKDIQVNSAAQTARIGAGLKWGEVLEKTQEYGLAPLLGSSPGVGVVGYTLGGGLGWLARKYGLAADSVLSFELVSADGQTLRASQAENADLFWGLRGGGGSFGVITAMEIQLYPVQTVYGGNLIYPIELARLVMQRYREWIRTAPDALTTSVVLMNYPPIPQMPEVLRGKSFVMVRGCFVGPVEEGESHLKTWRDWKTPLIDDFKPMSFRDVAKISSDPADPMPTHNSGAWVRELSDDAIDTLIRYAVPQGGPPALTMLEVRHAGGAVTRVEPHAAAFSHRDAELVLFCVGLTPTPETFQKLRKYTDELKRELQPALTGGLYMNFVAGQEARDNTRAGYSTETFQRLQALKARMDAGDTFRFSYAITPEK